LSNIQFGTGVVYGKPTAGNLPSFPSPFRFGVVQEVTVDFKADLKKLFSQQQFPVATARGKVDVTIKGKLAVFDPNLLNQLYFAQPAVSGRPQIADGELHTVNTAAVTVTNTPILEDWGVQYKATGQQLINAGGLTPNVGQYNVNLTSGVYTFAAGDNTNVVAVSYTYQVNSGTTITLASQLMGYAPELTMLLYNNFRNKYFAVELNDVTLGSISIPTKLEDFWISDFDGGANADQSGTLGRLLMDNF